MTAALWRDLAWVSARTVREKGRALRGPRPQPLTFPEVRSGRLTMRPLELTDSAAWTASMRANQDRMSPWWDSVADWSAATDSRAFLKHQLSWEWRRRRGEGIALAILCDGLLAGEALLWHVAPDRSRGELGLWCRPGLPARNLLGVMAGAVEVLFGELGLQRLDAPVAVGNPQPVRLLTIGGFRHEGRLRRWRGLNGELTDHDLYGLIAEDVPAALLAAASLTDWEIEGGRRMRPARAGDPGPGGDGRGGAAPTVPPAAVKAAVAGGLAVLGEHPQLPHEAGATEGF